MHEHAKQCIKSEEIILFKCDKKHKNTNELVKEVETE